jgi:hypothetical protein
VPPREDGTKAPLADLRDETGKPTWKPYTLTPATREHVLRWYANGRSGVGLATGFGGSECLEFESRDTYDDFIELAYESGLGELVDRIRTGYEEFTPGGGVHWLYRCDVVGSNTKLASRPRPTPENPHPVKTLIETRGQGGYVIIAPSNGRVHPTGGAYKLVSGGLGLMTTIYRDEREALFALARSFDEMAMAPDPDPVWDMRAGMKAPVTGVWPEVDKTPGDDFTERTSWEEILEPADWVKVFTRGEVTYWRRPGKDHGISATTGHCKGLKVFTTSTSFKTVGTYTKLGAYTALKHAGNFTAAIKKLAEQGYGTWIDNNGEVRQNPVPKDWRKKTGSTSGGDGSNPDLSWIEDDYATLADAEQELDDTAYAWDLWIPRGAIAAVVSDPGIGKTRLAVDWCARLWRGDLMPDGAANPFTEQTRTLWLCYDRNWRGLIRTFNAVGVPRRAVILPTRKKKPLWLPDFDSPETMQILRRFIEVHNPGWVVIDSTTYASKFNTGKPNEAKIAYDPIMDVLMETGCACLGLTHTNREGGVLNRRLLERCRVRIELTRPDPASKDRLRIEVTKSDDKKPAPLGAVFADNGVTYDSNPPEAPATPQRGRKPTTSPGLAEFLWEFISSKPAFVVDIVRAAQDKGLLKVPTDQEPKPSISPLYNARDWVARSHPGKVVDEFEMTTEKGKKLKVWQIIDDQVVTQPSNEDSPDDWTRQP